MPSGSSARLGSSSSRNWPGSRASRRRSIAAITSPLDVEPPASRSNRRGGGGAGLRPPPRGRGGGRRGGGGGGLAGQRLGIRRVAAQQPRAVGPAHELLALGELGQRRRHGG